MFSLAPSSAPHVVVIPTHTTRHLRHTLLGVACQQRRANLTVVSCDNDRTEIADLVARCAAEFGLPLRLVQRPFTGKARSGQVRNNAVRALGADAWPASTRLVFLDGDCCPAPAALEIHAQLAASQADALVIGHRYDLTEDQTAAFSEADLRAGRLPVEPTAAQLAALKQRDARYRRQVAFKRFGLTKSHKPKVLSANFSVALGTYIAINGFDEAYEGYGQEDDDFGRRVYQHGGRAVVGVAAIPVFHLYHPTRAPEAWDNSPNAERFLAGKSDSARCRLGLDNPAPQADLTITRFETQPAASLSAAPNAG